MSEPVFFTAEEEGKASHITVENDCACAENIRLQRFPMDALENDCACAPAAQQTSLSNLPTGSLFQKVVPAYQRALGQGFHVMLSPEAPLGPCLINDAALERWETFVNPHTIQNPLDRKLAQHGLLICSVYQPIPHSFSPTRLTAWLQITDRCNLACSYCYVKKTGDTLAVETGRQAIHKVFGLAQQGGMQRVKLKYAGGEALLFFNHIRELHKTAVKCAKDTGISLEEVVLSNGTLLRPAHVDWLVHTGARLMVSIDGIADAHDRQRPSIAGGATFDLIQHHIDTLLLPRGLRPHLSITITGQNAPGIAEILQWSLKRGLPFSLNFYRTTGTATSPQVLASETQAIIEGMRMAYHILETHLPDQSLVNSLLDHCQGEAHSLACGAGYSYLVITPDGSLAPCHMLMEPAHRSTFHKDPFSNPFGPNFMNLPVEQKHGCQACLFRYQCAGGCPIETMRVTGSWDQPSPNCTIYRTLLPDVLHLEGLRLLRSYQKSSQMR